MKKILFILSAIALIGYGCNKNEDRGSAAGTGVQQEEGTMRTTTPADTDVGSGASDVAPTSDATDTHLVPTERTDSTVDPQTTDPQRMESPSDVGTGSMEDDEMIDDVDERVDRVEDKVDNIEDRELEQ